MEKAARAAERAIFVQWEEPAGERERRRQALRESRSYHLGEEGDRLYAVADLEYDEQGNVRQDVPWRHSALRLPLDVRGAAAVLRRQFSLAERLELLRLVKWGETEER